MLPKPDAPKLSAPSKRIRLPVPVQAVATKEEQADETVQESDGKKKKRKVESLARTAKPEDLEPGTAVQYWDGLRGQVRDAFIPLDSFWVVGEENGELVRDEFGDIVQFTASELMLPVKPVEKASAFQKASSGGVLLLGTQEHMLKILQNFGDADKTARQNPQQLLAIPCNLCESGQIQKLAEQGVDDGVLELAQTLRDDISVGIRSFHFRQAVIRLAEHLPVLQSYFALASFQTPWPWEAIEASTDERQKTIRQEVQNQVDLCVSAVGEVPDETNEEVCAQRLLGEWCGVKVSDNLWGEEAQLQLRKRLGVPDMPLKFSNMDDVPVFVIIIPEDAQVATIKGMLSYSEAPSKPQGGPSVPTTSASSRMALASETSAGKVGGKTIAEWDRDQAVFDALPKLPPGWLRIQSRSGQVYFYNKRTEKATFDFPGSAPAPPAPPPTPPPPVVITPGPGPPLPPGWMKQESRSNGKVYYFHAKSNTSTYVRPQWAVN